MSPCLSLTHLKGNRPAVVWINAPSRPQGGASGRPEPFQDVRPSAHCWCKGRMMLSPQKMDLGQNRGALSGHPTRTPINVSPERRGRACPFRRTALCPFILQSQLDPSVHHQMTDQGLCIHTLNNDSAANKQQI